MTHFRNPTARALLALTMCALALVRVSPSTLHATTTLSDAFVLLDADNIAMMDQAVAFIRAQGGRVTVTFAPHALLARVPNDANWVGQAHIRAIVTDTADADLIARDYDAQAELAARAWNGLRAKARAPRQELPPGSDLINDTRIASDAPPRGVHSVSAPPSSYYTSMFAFGSVQVDVFLVESNGTIDANTENWTTTARDSVVSEITAALNWWVLAATQGGRPSANLSFNIVFHTPFNEPSIVATGYEPINRTTDDEGLWIGQVMTNLGYSGNYWSAVRSYDHARRTTFGRDWAYSIFVANSINDSNGLFADGYFAYAYLGGPFMVMTYDNDGWGISRMEMVAAHETSHIFNGLDEYASSGCTDTETSGYLNIANTNCENGTPATETSIMRSASNQQIAYPSYLISTPVRGQVGWRDSDGDGIYDVGDTTVQMSASRTSTPRAGFPMTYSGSATDIAFASPVYSAMSVNKITQVRYRMDGGTWLNGVPSDGAFNYYTENFTVATASLSEGAHTIEIQTLNTVGNYASYTDSFTLGTSKLMLPFVQK
ncbi:MAG: hypothetical protein HY868_19600 [Chloroflexi bacterium]|nr:hypothetical protein [Chloroflexota bacterium]